jgi:general secretion pathway protein D
MTIAALAVLLAVANSEAAVVPLAGEHAFLKCLKVPAGKVHLNFKPDMEISEVIGWFASVTCKGFIVQSGLNLSGRKVTLFSPSDVEPAELYRLFLALLDSAQLTVEPEGRFLRIIETTKVARARLPVYPAGVAPDRDDGYVTRLVHLGHADATEVAAVLQGYRGEQGTVVAYPPRGTLIITDRAGTVERLLALIGELDVPGEAQRLWSLPVRNVSAAELAATLSDILGVPATRPATAKQQAAPAPAPATATVASGVARLIPDERGGRLLVVATDPAFARVATLARQLDVSPDNRASQVHTYRCRNADCDAVAAILASLTGVQVSRGPAAASAPRPGSPAPPAPSATPSTSAPTPLFGGEVRITSDPSTNSLLVLCSLEDFRAVRRLVEEIDVPRKQVFVEATIMEVMVNKARTVGVGYHAGAAVGSSALALGGFDAGETLASDASSLSSALVGLSGMVLGAPLSGVASSLGLGSVPSLGVFLQLLQTENNVNLVANPQLLITNNGEGQISVGQVIPVKAGFLASAAAATSLNPVASISRENVALTLKLAPHVNDENVIRLEIDEEISELASEDFHGLGASTTKRTAQTTVHVHDQQTVVIGGLMRDRTSDVVRKVPVLGDIPLLGALFRHTEKTVENQNIIIALTPYVIEQPADLMRVLQAKLKDRRDFLRRYGSDPERRLLEGPLGPHSVGMLEEINRAVKTLEERDRDAAPAGAGEDPLATGVALPGS